MWTESRFISFDETPIFYRRLKLSENAKATVIILHGMGEHGGRYRPLAEYLAEFDVESLVPDLRGFGKSGGKRGCVKRFSDFHNDLNAVFALLERDQKEQTIFLIGHSFGALVAASYLAFYPRAKAGALVLTSPLFGIGVPVPFWRRFLGMAASRVAPDYIENSGVAAATLTHDKTILEAYRHDELIHRKISARLYTELCGTIVKRQQIASRIQIPVLLLQAGEDMVVSKEASLRFFDELKTADKEIEVYPGLYHEILNEAERDSIFARIGKWLLKHL